MKLMQLNTWMGRLTPQIVRLIEAEQPDILTTQELFQSDGPLVFPDNMFDCFDHVKAAGKFTHSFFSPVWAIPVAHNTATFGNAIFSKLPLSATETVFTHGQFNADLTPDSRIENTRNLQFATVDIHGQSVQLINYHAHWEMTAQGSAVSVERMQPVADRIVQLQGPIIFAGDLNVIPGTPTMQLLTGHLEDLTETYDVPTTLSELGKVSNVACDHILVNSSVQVQTFRVSQALVSDHLALIMEFDIPIHD